ncbi:MAG: hypothetical protein R3F38_04050 [Gammaproteobacteria bacterium]
MMIMLCRQLLALVFFAGAMTARAQPNTDCRETPTARCAIEQAIATWQTPSQRLLTIRCSQNTCCLKPSNTGYRPPDTAGFCAKDCAFEHVNA